LSPLGRPTATTHSRRRTADNTVATTPRPARSYGEWTEDTGQQRACSVSDDNEP
jgi:hypothetical protein